MRSNLMLFLLVVGMPAHCSQSNPQSELTEAIEAGSLDGVNAALDAGADPGFIADRYAGTPLMSASSRCHESIVNRLLSAGAQVNQQAMGGSTALAVARCLQVVQLLLTGGADPFIVDDGGFSVLFTHIRQPDVLDYLAGKYPRLLDMRPGSEEPGVEQVGWTPLMSAAAYGPIESVGILLRHGQDVNQQAPGSHTTALHLAVEAGDVEKVRLLVENGANPGLRSVNGTAFELAEQWGNDAILRVLRQGIPDQN